MNDSARPPFEPGGVATGIGSLPHGEIDDAVDAVFTHLPNGPFWPQLPRRSPLEGMTLQYAPGLPGLVETETSAGIDIEEKGQDELTSFYEKNLAGDIAASALDTTRAAAFPAFVERLKAQPAAERTLVKGHVTGPVTLASSLKDPEGREIINNPAFAEAVAHHLAANAVDQIRRLKSFSAPVVIFLDEPVMEAYGSAYSTLNEELVRGLWQPVLDAIRGEGAFSGIHCCGNTDWGLLFNCGTDIVNFDAYDFADRIVLYADATQRFLEEGGVLAWGIVPTDERAFDETMDSLLARLQDTMTKLTEGGVDPVRLRKQSLLTPACGLGSVSLDQATQVLTLTQELSEAFRSRSG